jgi:hypothetical protein
METLVALAPRIRNPIQLAAFLFAVLAIALIQFINPNDKQAMVVVGLIGVALVALALLFHPAVIKLFPASQRAPAVLLTLLLMFTSFGALAYVTAIATIKISPVGARFDTFLKQENVKVLRMDNDRYKVELTWNFMPLSKNPNEGATVFTGIVVLHDESLIQTSGAGSPTPATCAEVSSCMGSHYFRQLATSPLFVRADSKGTDHTVIIELKKLPKNLRIWWEFYQREGVSGGECRFNNAGGSAPTDGIPAVAVFSTSGQELAKECHRSFGQKTFEITI